MLQKMRRRDTDLSPVPLGLNVVPSELNVAEGITALREFLLLRYF